MRAHMRRTGLKAPGRKARTKAEAAARAAVEAKKAEAEAQAARAKTSDGVALSFTRAEKQEPLPPLPAPLDSLAWAALDASSADARAEMLLHVAHAGLLADDYVGHSVALTVCEHGAAAAETFLHQMIASARGGGKGGDGKGGGGKGGGGDGDAAGGGTSGGGEEWARARPELSAMASEEVVALVEMWLPAVAASGGDAAAVLSDLMDATADLDVSVDVSDTLPALLHAHGEAADAEARVSVARALVLVLGISGGSPATLVETLPIWLQDEAAAAAKAHADAQKRSAESVTTAQPSALVHTGATVCTMLGDEAGAHASASYAARREAGALDASDRRLERTIIALAALFIRRPDALAGGFQQLVPVVFDAYLCRGSSLRQELCRMLQEGGMDPGTVASVRDDDDLVRQVFFWSASGSKLFGHGPELTHPSTLRPLLCDALGQQPSIVFAFIEQSSARATAAATATSSAELALHVSASLHALLHLSAKRGIDTVGAVHRDTLVEGVLRLSSTHTECYAQCLATWSEHVDVAATLLDDFANGRVVKQLEGGKAVDAPLEARIQMLARLFIARPAQWTAFRSLVPSVFTSALKLGSAARTHLNELLLSNAFEPRLQALVCDSDEFVSAPFFWNSQVRDASHSPPARPIGYSPAHRVGATAAPPLRRRCAAVAPTCEPPNPPAPISVPLSTLLHPHTRRLPTSPAVSARAPPTPPPPASVPPTPPLQPSPATFPGDASLHSGPSRLALSDAQRSGADGKGRFRGSPPLSRRRSGTPPPAHRHAPRAWPAHRHASHSKRGIAIAPSATLRLSIATRCLSRPPPFLPSSLPTSLSAASLLATPRAAAAALVAARWR